MIAIVDYGLGNIRAFTNVYNKLSIPCCIAGSAKQLEAAERIILPGVGAFDHAMTMLDNSGLRQSLDSLVLEKSIPVLGVCVGMQIMANSSEEGSLAGLGWIEGKVRRFDLGDQDIAERLPLPHMGWNNLIIENEDPIFVELEAEPAFYFLHSYFLECEDPKASIANTNYGRNFCSAVRNGNIYGVQCHPEKSHRNGVALLRNFASIH